MKYIRSLAAGVALLLVLPGCSNKSEPTKVVGSYAPVIFGVELNTAPFVQSAGLAEGHEPAVRDSLNQVRVIVTNPNQIALKYHWTAASGTLLDSTAAVVRWQAPDVIGETDLTVAIEGTDTNGVYYYRVRSFRIAVDNAYTRWTRSQTTQFDPAPRQGAGLPGQGPLLYCEFANIVTGESAIWSVNSPEGPATQLTRTFFQAVSPSQRGDGGQFAFRGRKTPGDPAMTVYLLPAAGGDSTTARIVSTFNPVFNIIIAVPRFARAGTTLLFHSDSTSVNNPKPWVRDISNFGTPPARVIKAGQSPPFAWWNSSWNGAGDSVVAEGYRSFTSPSRIVRGLFKLLAIPPYQETTTPVLNSWLADSAAFEPDWSPDGQHIVFTRRNQAGDRDIWIIRADTSDKAQAVRVTRGPSDDAQPRFSADGAEVFFVSNRADRYGLNGIFDTERRGTNIWSVSHFDRP